MCGIVGGNNLNWNYEKSILSMKHRGPDKQKIVKFNEFVLGFARLSIIDLSDNGMQPMFSYNEDVCIVFNGEIYGYKDLRSKLEKMGYAFQSQSDTEVIINAYLEYGDLFIDHIDGMFAIAIYDRRTYEIKLFRDRAGIKPLYYYYDNKNFAFASELKAIESLCNEKALVIDYTAIYDYITYAYIPEPKTMYKKVYKLEKGFTLVYDVQRKKIKKLSNYWEVIPNTRQGSSKNIAVITEELRYLVAKSVKEQMIADVPVGCFLSGGIDSSIVTKEAYNINPNLETFSIGFSNKKYDELKYATLISTTFSIRENTQILDMKNFKNLYSRLKTWYDEPFCDTSAFPTYFVSKLAREKVTVALTGDGGDELFGGYHRYKRFIEDRLDKGADNQTLSMIYERICALLHMTTSVKLDEILLENVAKLCPLYSYEQKRVKQGLARQWGIDPNYDDYWYFRKYYRKDLPPITRMQYLDFNTYLPSDILTKVDRASMQVSLETRIPLLSKELMEFAFGLSENERCPKGELKGLLKNAYKDIIPNEILYRRKMGFGIPDNFIKRKTSQQETVLKDLWHI